MQFIRSMDLFIVIVIVLLFISGIAIYAVNRPAASVAVFHIEGVSFKLSEDNRSIEFYVMVDKGSIEAKEPFVNDTFVDKWSADTTVIGEGEKVRFELDYFWRMGKYYDIKLVTVDNRSAELVALSPKVPPKLTADISNVNVTSRLGSLEVATSYKAQATSIDSLHMLLFAYESFNKPNRSTYMFYDSRFLTNESLRRADTIIKYFTSFNFTIHTMNYSQLEELSKDKPRINLILPNPLKDDQGRSLTNAIPAPLIDPDRDGYVKDDSKYGRSMLYDWMNDEGLILITIGSLQPHKNILYEDGVYIHTKDSIDFFDVHLFLTNADGQESILKESFGNYAPTRISGTLGLSYRELSLSFDKNALERYNIQYYAYGDYKQPTMTGSLNLTIPIFVRVGEGGWLAMGDEEYWLNDKAFSHDLFLIFMQSIWDSRWIPYGWYWDSSATFRTSSAAVITLNGSLITGRMPSSSDILIVRFIGIAYSTELDEGILYDKIFNIETST